MCDITINDFRNNKRKMKEWFSDFFSIFMGFFTIMSTIIIVWYNHEKKINELKSRADSCDEKHKHQSEINNNQRYHNENHAKLLEKVAGEASEMKGYLKAISEKLR